SAALKRQEVLVVEMRGELVKIGLQRDGLRDAEIEGFSACCIREFGKVRLRSVGDEESAPAMPRIRSVDCPNVDILLLRAADRRIEIGRPGPKISAKIVNAGREQEYGMPVRGGRPPLH